MNSGHIRTITGCLGGEALVSISPHLEWGRFCSKTSFPENEGTTLSYGDTVNRWL